MNALPTIRDGSFSFTADDGTPLVGTLHEAVDPKGAVLIAGAVATPHRYYRAFAAWLAERGYTALSFDYRGIGASRAGSLRGSEASLTDWGTHDVSAALRTLREATPGLDVYVVGHSFGGQAFGLNDGLGEVSGVLAIGSSLPWLGHWPVPQRWALSALWGGLFPATIATVGFVPSQLGLGEDLPPRAAAEWARWCRSRRYLIDHVDGAEERFRRFRGRSEVWALTDDTYAPIPAVQALAAVLGPDGAYLRQVSPARTGGSPIGHFGPFRPAFRDTLWADVEDVLMGWQAEPERAGGVR